MEDHGMDAGPDSGDIEAAVDQRERAADVREDALDTRESELTVREDAESDRADRVQKILTAAEERDDRADVRDGVAIKRHVDAELDARMNGTENDEAEEARRLAWDARAHSRRDRVASSDDRDDLAWETGTQSG